MTENNTLSRGKTSPSPSSGDLGKTLERLYKLAVVVLAAFIVLGVTLLVAFFWLGERMSGAQWGGVLLLLISVLLSRWDPKLHDAVYRPVPPRPALFGGLGLNVPLKASRFFSLSRLYRRQPRSELPGDLRQDEHPG